MVKRRPGPNAGKANASGEETGRGTLEAAGVGVQTRRQRSAEITSGRSDTQPGLAATGKDRVYEGNTEACGGCRIGAGARRSNEGGVMPADVPRDGTAPAVTPAVCKGALGTWRTVERAWTQSQGNSTHKLGLDSQVN